MAVGEIRLPSGFVRPAPRCRGVRPRPERGNENWVTQPAYDVLQRRSMGGGARVGRVARTYDEHDGDRGDPSCEESRISVVQSAWHGLSLRSGRSDKFRCVSTRPRRADPGR